ncbi:MAG: hypothetical protein AAFX09_04855 [Pseudomonadota bacterium]
MIQHVWTLMAGLLVLLGATPVNAQSHDADLYAVYFRSDNCPNCLILDPQLIEAREATARLPIRHLTLNLDDAAEDYDAVMFAMLDRGLADLYNAYLGLTGVVFLIAPDTGLPVDCLTRRDDAERQAQRLENALGQVYSRAPDERTPVVGSQCPPPLRTLPGGRVFGVIE